MCDCERQLYVATCEQLFPLCLPLHLFISLHDTLSHSSAIIQVMKYPCLKTLFLLVNTGKVSMTPSLGKKHNITWILINNYAVNEVTLSHSQEKSHSFKLLLERTTDILLSSSPCEDIQFSLDQNLAVDIFFCQAFASLTMRLTCFNPAEEIYTLYKNTSS